MIKYTVIIPIYNMEKYLDECILSVVNQHRKDIELILINDGSTDDSLNICKKYKKEYDYIRIIDKSNSGITDTIARGIKESKGEYTCFIDADDFISNDFFNIIDNNIDEKIDIIMFNHIRYYRKSEILVKQNMLDYGIVDTHNLNKIKYNYFSNYNRYTLYRWDKVIKTSILKENITTMDVYPTYLEDHIISLLNLIKANTILYIDDYLYYYRVRKNSVSHTINERIFEDWNIVYSKVKQICSENNYSKEATSSMNRYFLYQYCRYSLKSKKEHRNIKISIDDIRKTKGKEKKIILILYKLRLKLVYNIIIRIKARKEIKNDKELFD